MNTVRSMTSIQTERLRLDKYLWAIRIFKTRSQASEACDQGKVKFQGLGVKASRQVKIGDEYEIRTPARKWIIRVDQLQDHRVAYQEAIACYTDLTPPEDQELNNRLSESFYPGQRQSKIGRPTKRQRRNLDDFMDAPSQEGPQT